MQQEQHCPRSTFMNMDNSPKQYDNHYHRYHNKSHNDRNTGEYSDTHNNDDDDVHDDDDDKADNVNDEGDTNKSNDIFICLGNFSSLVKSGKAVISEP